MKELAIKPTSSLDAPAIVSQAVSRAANQLEISGPALSKILGLSQSSISRLHSGTYLLKEDHKEWELALLLIRLYRSLLAITATHTLAKTWLSSPNLSLPRPPRELITDTEGLVNVVNYLDASRGPI
jgi:hypothetical protein